MASVLRFCAILCLALLPLEVLAQQGVTPGAPLDLGFIPTGEERMVQLSGRLNLETASEEEAMAAVQQAAFSISQDAGFCIAATVPAEPVLFILVGRETADSPVLFDVNSSVASADERVLFVATSSPIAQTRFLLSTVVAQTALAPGTTVNLFIRAFPDTTSLDRLQALCTASGS